MLMLQFYPLTGGYETQSLLIARELVRRRVPVQVVTRRFAKLRRHEVYCDIPVHRVRAVGDGHLGAVTYMIASFVSLARIRGRVSVLFSNRLSSGIAASIIGRILGKPVLCRLTSGDEVERARLLTTWYGRVKLFCLRGGVDCFVALTQKIENDLKAVGIPAERIVRISNGVELVPRRYDREAICRELDLEPRARVVVFVGRLAPEKGVDLLLRAWPGVVAAAPDARLLVVGDGAERPILEAAARQLGITGSVRFVGSQTDVFRFHAVSDVFVLPSRREGISNALLEALSLGLPAVVGDDRFGGNRELVGDGQNGFVVPREDVPALRDALLRLIGDADLRTRMGQCARERVARTAAIERIAERYAEVCERLTRGLPPAPVEAVP
jgi:glycosyltransferase involved in cell wall biosynthesis